MKTADFFKRPLTEQCRILYLEGEFVMAIRYYKFKVNLYRLGRAYIEVFFNHKRGVIESVRPLDAGSSRMKFYADQVKLPAGMPAYSGK